MKITIEFNGSFTGLIYSTGYSYDTECIYINGSGRSRYEFFIQLNRCGTLGGNNDNEIDQSKKDKTAVSSKTFILKIQIRRDNYNILLPPPPPKNRGNI